MSKGMEELKIHRYQAETIENALRIAMNILDSRVKQTETAADRELLRADKYIKNVLMGTIDAMIDYPLKPEDTINSWDLIAKKLGLREVDKPTNTWYDENGFEYRLTKYGFELVKTAPHNVVSNISQVEKVPCYSCKGSGCANCDGIGYQIK